MLYWGFLLYLFSDLRIIRGAVSYLLQIFLLWILLEIVGHDVVWGSGGAMFSCGEMGVWKYERQCKSDWIRGRPYLSECPHSKQTSACSLVLLFLMPASSNRCCQTARYQLQWLPETLTISKPSPSSLYRLRPSFFKRQFCLKYKKIFKVVPLIMGMLQLAIPSESYLRIRSLCIIWFLR